MYRRSDTPVGFGMRIAPGIARLIPRPDCFFKRSGDLICESLFRRMEEFTDLLVPQDR